MCGPIIPRAPRVCNTPACPNCQAPATFSSSRRRLSCPACSLSISLSPEEARDLSDALLGISDLPLDLFLREIAGAREEMRGA